VTDSTSIVIDLDGVVWLAGEQLPGVGQACQALRDAGFRLQFATNNSAPTNATLKSRLVMAGIYCGDDEVITAAQAAASLLAPKTTVFALGEEGLTEACSHFGLVEGSDPEAVIVGWCHNFGFTEIAEAATAIRKGARFIATNDDPTHPTPTGLLPGTGSLVAAIATAAEASPEIAGKPGSAMVALIEQRCSDVALVIGDRPSTDGALARALNRPFALVSSEATPVHDPTAAISGASLLEVVTTFLE
jgi:HAD superfamily hydrolase (TIGR01450 family)